jgi:hypothetical protein
LERLGDFADALRSALSKDENLNRLTDEAQVNLTILAGSLERLSSGTTPFRTDPSSGSIDILVGESGGIHIDRLFQAVFEPTADAPDDMDLALADVTIFKINGVVADTDRWKELGFTVNRDQQSIFHLQLVVLDEEQEQVHLRSTTNILTKTGEKTCII